MKKYDCVFLDRDGTINSDPGYIKNLKNYKFYDFLFPALKKISEVCNKFCIISNQSGVSRGMIQCSEGNTQGQGASLNIFNNSNTFNQTSRTTPQRFL